MRSNADQFEAMGFPWVSERDRREMPVRGPSLKVKRAAPRFAGVKPEFRDEAVVRRALTAQEVRNAKHRAALAEVRSLARASRFFTHIDAPSATPLVEPGRAVPPPIVTEAEKAERAAAFAARAAAQTAVAHRAAAAREAVKFNNFGAAMSAALDD